MLINISIMNKYCAVFICIVMTLKINAHAFNIPVNSQTPTAPNNDIDDILYNNELSDNSSTTIVRRSKRGLDNLLIAPNTRWCGKGTTADAYNNLGGASAADKCCRQHDHCNYYIPAMGTRYDYFNYNIYTLSHCQCDRRFRTCLKMANDEHANAIGQLFFNVGQMRCFVLRQEKICRSRAADGTCEKEDTKLKAYVREIERY